jgi:hypothetical protein
MNDQPKKIREGFITDQPVVDLTPEPPSLAEQEPVEPEIQIEKWPITVKLLYRSIRTDKVQELRELTFREPRGGDINRYGNPVRIDQNGEVIIDDRKMTMIMAALSGINYPFLEAMDPRDWASCAYRLRSFFLPDPRSW